MPPASLPPSLPSCPPPPSAGDREKSLFRPGVLFARAARPLTACLPMIIIIITRRIALSRSLCIGCAQMNESVESSVPCAARACSRFFCMGALPPLVHSPRFPLVAFFQAGGRAFLLIPPSCVLLSSKISRYPVKSIPRPVPILENSREKLLQRIQNTIRGMFLH